MVVLGPIVDSLREAFFMFWQTLWALILGFTLSGAVQAFVTRGEMSRALGAPGARSTGRATFLGMVSSSCSYAATAMAKTLFQKGADFTAAMVFMIASTNLVFELGIVLALLLGWQFTASEFVGGFLMIAMFALVARFFFPRGWVEAARARVQAVGGGHDHQAMTGVAQADPEAARGVPFWRRVRSRAGWSDAAGYTVADMTMLRKEMLIGFGVAGFLAVLVPTGVWSAVFVSGHGFWTSLENAVVGPMVAIISFVCSIGNVPLAAALWKGGISFGGVVAFIFADLITLPLLLIYRKYFGTRMALRLLAAFWLVMSAGGLVVELVFAGAGLVPAARPTQIVPSTVTLDHTAILNVMFVAVLAVLYHLHRNRARYGGGAGYAIDPVCGMQVETASAPARVTVAGTTHHFCSDGCREAFERRAAEPAAGRSTGALSQEPERHAAVADHH